MNFTVVFVFDGFFRPVDNLPIINLAKAGSAVPLKFSLNGYQGMAIIAAGYPRVQPVVCSVGTIDEVDTTVNAGGSSLSYDPLTDQYNYVWKTDKNWANKCLDLNVKLVDGTEHVARFQFKK